MRTAVIIILSLIFGWTAASLAEDTGPTWTQPIPGNPRIYQRENRIELRWDATNDDLAQLGDARGIIALHYGGWPIGGDPPLIDDEGVAHLARWRDLRELVFCPYIGDRTGRLTPHHITDAGLKHLSGLIQLRKLVLLDQAITDAGIAHLSNLTGLEELRLDGIPLTDATPTHLQNLTNLKVLRFHRAKITDAGIAHLSKMTQLQDLQLGLAQVSDTGMQTIGKMTHLQTLDLQHNRISDAGLQQIAGLTQLTWLCLNDTAVSDAGLEHLRSLTGLQFLYLERTKVTSAGLNALKPLMHLRVLYLDGTAVGDDGVEALAALPALQRLQLNHTGLTDAGLLKLASLKSLKELEIEGTAVTPQGLAAFKQAAGHVSVKPQTIKPPPTPAELDARARGAFDYMHDHVLDRLDAWRNTQPRSTRALAGYVTELRIELDPPRLLLDDGTDRLRSNGLPTEFAWKLYRITPDGVKELQVPARLKLQGLASQPNICKEVFVLQGRMAGNRGVFIDITTHDLRFTAGAGIADLASYRFPADQYSPSPGAIDQSLLIRQPVTTGASGR